MPVRPPPRTYAYIAGAAVALLLVVFAVVALQGQDTDSAPPSSASAAATTTSAEVDGIAAVRRTYAGCVDVLNAYDFVQGGNVVTAQSDRGPLAWDITGGTPVPTESTTAVLDAVGCG